LSSLSGGLQFSEKLFGQYFEEAGSSGNSPSSL
jgi:hypothetical protein